MSGNKRSLRAARGVVPLSSAGGAAALIGWVQGRAGNYETVAQRRDADGATIDRALEIVRQFIIDRQLVLFGGLAIDYAMRLKGERLYPDDRRPDFDFISTRSVEDAYDLADALVAAGFDGVGAVRGVHATTMRVRAGYTWVADIGYAPPAVFEKIPTLEYRAMRFVHPDFQRIDMHLAFCFPFNAPPREDIFNRWAKDLKRFNLFEKFYPIPADARAWPTRRATVAVPAAIAGADPAHLRMALHGFAAYAVLRAALDELAAAFKAPPPPVAAPRLELAFAGEASLRVEVPEGAEADLEVVSPWAKELTAGLAGAERRRPYVDMYFESYTAGPLTIYDSSPRLLAAALVRAAPDGRVAFTVSPQFLLMRLMAGAHRAESESGRAMYRAFYAATLEVIGAAENLYADAAAAVPESRDALMTSFMASPFAPSLTTIGDRNQDASYLIRMATNAERLREAPPAALQIDVDVKSLLVGLPTNYYPGKGKNHPPFAYDNDLFRRDGRVWN